MNKPKKKTGVKDLLFGDLWEYAPAPQGSDFAKHKERYGHFIGGEFVEPLPEFTGARRPAEQAAPPGAHPDRRDSARRPVVWLPVAFVPCRSRHDGVREFEAAAA